MLGNLWLQGSERWVRKTASRAPGQTPCAVQAGPKKNKALIICIQDALCSPAAAAAPAQAVPLVLCPPWERGGLSVLGLCPSREIRNADLLVGWWSSAVGAHLSREKLKKKKEEKKELFQISPFPLPGLGRRWLQGGSTGDADSNILGYFPRLILGDRLVIDQNACLPLV